MQQQDRAFPAMKSYCWKASDIQSVDDELHVADAHVSSWDGVVEHPSGLA
jgi:hypothetical protein